MAAMALDQHDEWADLGFVRAPMQDLPPELIHWIGVKIVRDALGRVDDAVHEGRKPNLVNRKLASLLASGVVSHSGE